MKEIINYRTAQKQAILEKFGIVADPHIPSLTDTQLEKAIQNDNLTVYTPEALQLFIGDLNSFGSDVEIEKAQKDLSKLTKIKVTDKNGHSVFRWVKPGEEPKGAVKVGKEDDKKGKKPAKQEDPKSKKPAKKEDPKGGKKAESKGDSKDSAGETVGSMKSFEDIVKNSKTVEEAFAAAKNIKNVEAGTAGAFREKYDPDHKLSPRGAFEKFYNEVKAGGNDGDVDKAAGEKKKAAEKAANKKPKAKTLDQQVTDVLIANSFDSTQTVSKAEFEKLKVKLSRKVEDLATKTSSSSANRQKLQRYGELLGMVKKELEGMDEASVPEESPKPAPASTSNDKITQLKSDMEEAKVKAEAMEDEYITNRGGGVTEKQMETALDEYKDLLKQYVKASQPKAESKESFEDNFDERFDFNKFSKEYEKLSSMSANTETAAALNRLRYDMHIKDYDTKDGKRGELYKKLSDDPKRKTEPKAPTPR